LASPALAIPPSTADPLRAVVDDRPDPSDAAANAAEDVCLGDVVADRFAIERLAGKGGLGVV
jgi:hypothetical protein